MIKLVSQFDNGKSKLSLATPTCGCCCCCCCCCIISTFATANVSARSFGNFAQKHTPNEPDKIKSARNFGFWFPIGAVISLIVGFFVDEWFFEESIYIIMLPVIIYTLLISILFINKIKIKGIVPQIIVLVITTVVAEVFGVIVGIFAIVLLRWFYIVLALIAAAYFIIKTFSTSYDEKSIDDIEINEKDEIVPTESTLINNKAMHDSKNNEKKILNKRVKMKKCPKCGKENNYDNKRCFYCSHIFEVENKNENS